MQQTYVLLGDTYLREWSTILEYRRSLLIVQVTFSHARYAVQYRLQIALHSLLELDQRAIRDRFYHICVLVT